MKCTLDYDKILAYSLGYLDGEEAELVSRHSASCPRCTRELMAMDAISRGLSALPRIEPGAERWGELRTALERERRPGAIALLASLVHGLRRPAVAAGAILLLLCALVLRLSTRRETIPAHTGTAIEEMGSRIAHARPGDQGFSDAMDSYLNDARTIVSGLPACAASGDSGCWSSLKEKIIESDMLYRATCLREQLAAPSRGMRGGGAPHQAGGDESRTLVDDLISIFRAISERSPERLVSEGGALENEIKRLDLLNRLGKGGGR